MQIQTYANTKTLHAYLRRKVILCRLHLLLRSERKIKIEDKGSQVIAWESSTASQKNQEQGIRAQWCFRLR